MAIHPLTIDMQDGFYNDTLVVSCDDSELFRQSELTTRMQLNLAESRTVALEGGLHEICCQLPEKSTELRFNLDIQQPLYLAIRLSNDHGLQYTIQDRPFRYA